MVLSLDSSLDPSSFLTLSDSCGEPQLPSAVIMELSLNLSSLVLIYKLSMDLKQDKQEPYCGIALWTRVLEEQHQNYLNEDYDTISHD